MSGTFGNPDLAARFREFEMRASRAASSIFISRGQPLFGAPTGPLANRLAGVKDNIDVAGFETTAACPAFAYRPTRSAEVVERALRAGASVVGKTNLDQFACGLVGTRSPYGAVPNSFNPDYVSGGSSSGSAVAVALGLVDFSFGTDTAGSGRVPAGFNNIVGIKPTRGVLSGRGVIPACQHIDCVSIFARTVPEALDVLLACSGFDPEDPFSRNAALSSEAMPLHFSFGIPDAEHLEFFGDTLAAQEFGRALERLASLGGTCSEFGYGPLAQAANALYEGPWVAERYAAIRPFFDAHIDEVHPVVRAIIEKGRTYSAADLFAAMAEMGLARQYAQGLWDDIDVMVVPTAPNFPTIAELDAEPVARNRQLGYYTNFVNLLDLAAVAVPSSIRSDGLPFGITLIGPAGSELRLADLAQRIHVASGLPLGAPGAEGALGYAAGASGNVAQHATASLLPRPPASTVTVAVVGAHLSGMPLNGQLTDRGGRLLEVAHTQSSYRLYALANTTPAKPGLVRVNEPGAAIETELWEMPVAQYGSFVAGIPSPLGIGTLELADGRSVQGFLCEPAALAGARDVTEFGGWRAYLASLS